VDQRQLVRATAYSAVATALGSAGLSMWASALGADSKLWLGPILVLFAAAFAIPSYRYWTGGVTPRPPRKPIEVQSVLGLLDKWSGASDVGVRQTVVERTFMQDASDGLIQLWGRIRRADSPSGLDETFGMAASIPRVPIPSAHWSLADLDYSAGTTKPRSRQDSAANQYFDLILDRRALWRRVILNRLSGRYRVFEPIKHPIQRV
jgi:hypothetical protein